MSRTNYIFIDYENVPQAGLDRIADRPVRVVLVLGQRQRNLPVPLVQTMLKCPDRVRLVETELNGKNALDFVLACEVGAEAERNPTGYFHIVSRDTGFDALVTHLRSRSVFAARCASLDEIRVLMDGSERRKYCAIRLKDNPASRPKTRITLASQVQSWFGKSLSAEEVEDAIAGPIAEKLVTISDKGAVTYNA